MSESDVADAAHRSLRRTLSGDLRFDEHVRPLRFVIAPEGHLVAPVMVAMLESVDAVLMLPSEAEALEEPLPDPSGEPAAGVRRQMPLQLQVSLEPFDPSGPRGGLADRWRAYHGEPEDVRWALMAIDAARTGVHFLDGLALMRPNPLAAIEARACRALNARRDALREACRERLGVSIEAPVAVGVDPGGIDVRGAFEVRRLEVAQSMESLEDVLAAVGG
ncbi:MAG TPA: hypothetical protein PKC43_14165 [Phycisphaerales bacterium]|nr:hypothetical protein [Phycisphaerales bacterium]HMP38578.1 hypothetical protein [Phycisphaerales bacterium]